MMEKQERVLEECLAYFRGRPVYQKLFQKLRDKYVSLGYMGGKVTLTGLKPDDRMYLGGFFQKDYSENKSVTISVSFFEETLAESKFSDVTLEEILTAYFGTVLVAKKEQKRQEEERKSSFFETIMQQSEEGEGKKWLKKVLAEHGEGYHLLMQQYKEDSNQLRKILLTVLAGIQKLPVAKKELLAVFAARTTGNPHYYDEGTTGEKLLTAFLKEHVKLDFKKEQELSYVERKNRLLYEAGILKDDLSNDSLVYGIHALNSDGEQHKGIEGFCNMKEAVRITLLTVGNLQKVWPQNSERIVYVVENPAVFSVLSQHYPDSTFICGNGQPRLATLLLMDMLQENSIFYYAGDFDPEGLLIAQRLKKRYGEKLILWNYKVEWYEKYLSPVELDAKRLKKLERIDIEELQIIKEQMYIQKKAVYQEAMMEKYIEDEAIKNK